MGQSQSRPHSGAVSPRGKPPTPQPSRHAKKKPLPVPENWKNNAEFNQISPVSDISNPSQFRGRLHHHNNSAPTTSTGGVRANASRRASKVCPKQPPPKKGAVPTPANFYFPEDDLRNEDDTVSADSPVKKPTLPPTQPQPQAPNKNEIAAPPVVVPPTIHVGRPWMEIWKAKCIKAKQQLSTCFQQHLEEKVNEREKHPVERKKSLPSQPHQQSNNKHNKAYLQFDPVWKEGGGIMSPGNEKDERAYVHRLSGTESGSSLDKSENEKSKQQPPKKIPAVGSSVLERIQSLQQASCSSSNNSFQANRLSVGTDHTRSSTSSRETRRVESRVQEKESNKHNEAPSKNQVEKVRNTRHSSDSNLPKSNNTMIEKKAVRVNNAEIFRTTSSERITTKRASIGRSFSSGSHDLEDKRRASIQEQVQLQIDAQKAGRVQRLRQQYLEQIHSEKQKSTKRRSRSVPARTSENRLERREISKPPPPANQKTKTRTEVAQSSNGGQRARSASVPRTRPSIDGSALLHLSGWKDNKCYEKKEQPLPALLQVAGWKPPSTKVSTENRTVHSKPTKASSSADQSQGKKSSTTARRPEPSQSAPKESAVPFTVEPKSRPDRPVPVKPSFSESSVAIGTTKTEEALRCSQEELAGDSPQPQFLRAKPVGKPLAEMLLQAYFRSDEDDLDCGTLQMPYGQKKEYDREESPSSESAISPCSAASGPLLSNQAIYNADFLFTSNPIVFDAPRPSNGGNGHSISTLDSRFRVPTCSGQAVAIHPTSSKDNSSLTSASSGDYRRVRFSDELVVNHNDRRLIERNLSDLTDTTSATTNTTRTSSLSAIPRIDSIPEDDAEDAISKSPVPSIMDADSAPDDGPVAVFEDTEDDFDGHEDDQKSTPSKSPVMRWTYHTENGLTKGVTPMINGKTSSIAPQVTRSPYLRFKEAKEKFTTSKAKKESPAKKRVSPAKKRISPGKKTSLVSSRIAAMEGRRARSETGATTKIVMPRKVRRNTTGDQVLAPRKGSLVSPMFKQQQQSSTQKRSRAGEEFVMTKPDAQSPTLVDGHVIGSPPQVEYVDESPMVSPEEDDDFDAIRHPTTLDDEDSSGSGGSDSDDDFDNLLQTTRGMSVNDDGSSYQQSSIGSTILRGPRYSSGNSPHSTATHSIASTVVVNRHRSSAASFLSSSDSSLGDSAGMLSLVRKKDENAIPSAVDRMVKHTQAQNFPFRDTAKVVKPNEQIHRAVAGSKTLSHMQRTPLEARTWRALAAAAQDKKRNNLTERDLNSARPKHHG